MVFSNAYFSGGSARFFSSDHATEFNKDATSNNNEINKVDLIAMPMLGIQLIAINVIISF
jgi:hypothetical protein